MSFSLFDEVYGWHRVADDEPAVSLGKSASGDQPDVLDATAPFSALFAFQPSTGRASSLIKGIESADVVSKVLGGDLMDALKGPEPSTDALDKRITEVSQRVADNLLGKASRIVATAPLRKSAVAGMVDRFKQNLVRKGHRDGVEAFGSDGWERLTASMESYVTETLAAA
jgi:hypothetical protein